MAPNASGRIDPDSIRTELQSGKFTHIANAMAFFKEIIFRIETMANLVITSKHYIFRSCFTINCKIQRHLQFYKFVQISFKLLKTKKNEIKQSLLLLVNIKIAKVKPTMKASQRSLFDKLVPFEYHQGAK